MAFQLQSQRRMDRALRLARAALESSGDVGLALSISLLALHYLWLSRRWELR